MHGERRRGQHGAPGAAEDGSAGRPTVAMLMPSSIREHMLSPEAERQLASFARVVSPPGPELSADDLPALLGGAVACLTGWGTPPLHADLLARSPDLRLVAHTAGSIRRLVPRAAMECGLRVSHAAAIIADAVAEFVIAQTLLCLRRLRELDAAMKAGQPWDAMKARFPGRLLGGKTAGVVGAGRVGRAVIPLLKAFGCRVLVSDPFLTPDDAAAIGVEQAGLDEVFSMADVVTIHVPVLPETQRMIGARQLKLLRDGTMFINTARAAVVDADALLGEITTGRFVAALDVFDPEPLPADSPLRTLPNVLLSPHVAGLTRDTYRRQGQAMVDEVQRFVAHEPLQYEIPLALLPMMA